MTQIAPWSKFCPSGFLLGAHRLDQLPADLGREIAVAGRSNAGKSSAINTLTQTRALARTSKTPGRTQQINVFIMGATGCRLVDLPGYGYAEVSPAMKQHWARVLPRYLAERQSLVGLLIAMDIRHPLRDGDCALIAALAARRLPTRILLTKCDKLSRSAQVAALRELGTWCQDQGEFLSVQLFSSPKRLGVDPAREWMIRLWSGAPTEVPPAPADP